MGEAINRIEREGNGALCAAEHFPIPREMREGILNEKDRVAKLGRIRQFVFGSLDGLLVPLGVISGVAGGTGNLKAVIVAGLAESFAGAISMGAGEFLSGRAEAQVHQAEVRKELRQIKQNPAYELQEMIVILESEGVNPEDARLIAKRLHDNPQSLARTMVQKELGLEVEQETVRLADGLTMGFSYIAASMVPLVSYFFCRSKPPSSSQSCSPFWSSAESELCAANWRKSIW